jgi:hypothetical protein
MKFNSEESYRASQEPENIVTEEEFGCGFCWDRRKKKEKELFFLDAANNMRICNYCPSCGRKYNEE